MSKSLQAFSDRELLNHTSSLVASEREDALRVLLCLNEIESRQLHLKLGYGSLFDYCTGALGYSSSAAGRRIQAARCSARFPALYKMLERNQVTLSTVSQISRCIDECNSSDLLSRVAGKSQREVESIVAEYQPLARFADRARTVVVRVPAAVSHATTDTAIRASGEAVTASASLFQPAPEVDACEKNDYSRNGSEHSESTPEQNVEKRVLIRFSVSPEFMEKLERVRAIAWHRLPPRATYEDIFEFVLNEYLERHDPANKQKRREKRSKGAAHVSESEPVPGKRYIPAEVRDQVFERDGGQCTFVGINNHRCTSTQALQIDHIVPVALGGTSTADNLRLLCAKHNRAEAERLLGTAAVPH